MHTCRWSRTWQHQADHSDSWQSPELAAGDWWRSLQPHGHMPAMHSGQRSLERGAALCLQNPKEKQQRHLLLIQAYVSLFEVCDFTQNYSTTASHLNVVERFVCSQWPWELWIPCPEIKKQSPLLQVDLRAELTGECLITRPWYVVHDWVQFRVTIFRTLWKASRRTW